MTNVFLLILISNNTELYTYNVDIFINGSKKKSMHSYDILTYQVLINTYPSVASLENKKVKIPISIPWIIKTLGTYLFYDTNYNSYYFKIQYVINSWKLLLLEYLVLFGKVSLETWVYSTHISKACVLWVTAGRNTLPNQFI